jgi:four helix bundle protein
LPLAPCSSGVFRTFRVGTNPAAGTSVPKISSFRDLLVWQKAMALAEGAYRFSKGLPRDDQLVLGHQIRKSCVSVPSNIAEGFGRPSTAEYIHHLRFSKGSVNELQTQVELARRLQIVSEAEAATMMSNAEEVGRMLNGLINSLRR